MIHKFVIAYALKVLFQALKMNLAPLGKQDLAFISGKINQDEFLASLYIRDEAIEVNQYENQFLTNTELEEIGQIIKNLHVNVLADRLLKHADLTTDFRHFQILRFEPYNEIETLDLQSVPFLLSKTANLKRYYAGKLHIVLRRQYQFC